MKISEKLHQQLISWGASLVAFADLQPFLPKRFSTLPRGVSIAVQLSNAIIDEIEKGPTKAYAYHYYAVNRLLDQLAIRATNWLQSGGYQAWPVPTSQTISSENQAGHLSHKFVATRAGLGWVGKNALLINPEYGPRVRLTSILTDAPLNTGTPIEESHCGECTACVMACPVKALRGNTWSPRGQRADLLKVNRCVSVIEESKQRLGAPVCGVCIQACPKGGKNPHTSD